MPTAEQIVADIVLPVLQEHDHSLRLELGRTSASCSCRRCSTTCEAIGRTAQNICFVEPKYAGSGPDEQEALAQYYHDRHGLKIMHADPAELTLQDGEVCYDGERVDLAYRDYAVRDLLDLRAGGRRRRADAAALPAEPHDLVDRRRARPEELLGGADRSAVHAEVLQRRRAAGLPPAHPVDAHPVRPQDACCPTAEAATCSSYVRREHETLVLKPNRAYGGEGVVIGPAMTAAGVGGGPRRRLGRPADRWVVQQLASIPVSEFPVVGPDGKLHIEPFYTVMGFAPSKYGLAILGRASQKQVVNVAQRGGMCGVMIGHPPALGGAGVGWAIRRSQVDLPRKLRHLERLAV